MLDIFQQQPMFTFLGQTPCMYVNYPSSFLSAIFCTSNLSQSSRLGYKTKVKCAQKTVIIIVYLS